MFTKFSLMLQAFFAAFTKLAQGTEKFASAFDHLGGVAEQTAASFADQAAMERNEKMAILKHNMEQRQKQLAATEGQVALPAPSEA